MINETHKDRLFCFIFGRRENRAWTLSLYNAVNHSSYANPDEIEINTIEDVIYMGMKNDVSFLLQWTMNIWEHQSSYNPNMPVRELMYTGKLYDKYIHRKRLNIYGSKKFILPVPKLVVFYNGTNDQPDETTLQLRDSFPEEVQGESDIDVRVKMININHGHNEALMQSCKALSEYAWFIDQIRSHIKEGIEIEEAVNRTFDEMPAEFEIRGFLEDNRSEVMSYCLTEYNEAETMELFKAEVEDNTARLMGILASNGRYDDIKKASHDKHFRHQLFEEFADQLSEKTTAVS